MITIPLNSNTTSVVSQQERVRRDFSNFFYRTVGVMVNGDGIEIHGGC